jgi:hypothetical protein
MTDFGSSPSQFVLAQYPIHPFDGYSVKVIVCPDPALAFGINISTTAASVL